MNPDERRLFQAFARVLLSTLATLAYRPPASRDKISAYEKSILPSDPGLRFYRAGGRHNPLGGDLGSESGSATGRREPDARLETGVPESDPPRDRSPERGRQHRAGAALQRLRQGDRGHRRGPH